MGKTPIFLLAVITVSFFTAQTAWPADWPQYKRDAARSAQAPGDSFAFPLKRVVAVKFSSPIYASAAVVNGKVYAVDERGLLACIEKATNSVLWWAEIGGVSNRSSPAVAGNRIFVGSTAGYLMVLDANSGAEITRLPADGGIIAAPAIANNAVYCLSFNGTMYKADLSGNPVWSYKYPTVRASDQEFMVRGDTLVFIAGPYDSTGAGEPYIIHIVRDLGDHAAQLEIIRFADWIITPMPQRWIDLGLHMAGGWGGGGHLGNVYGDARVTAKNCMVGGITTSSFKPRGSFEIDGSFCFYMLNSGTYENGGTVLWSYKTTRMNKPNGMITATASIADGVAYAGGEDGVLYGLGAGNGDVPIVSILPDSVHDRPGERLTGYEWPTAGGDMGYSAVSPDRMLKPPFRIYWKTRTSSIGGYVWGIAAAGKVFMTSYTGFLEALDAETGEILWRNAHLVKAYGTQDQAPPTYADGKILVMRQNGLWCFDAENGDSLWHSLKPDYGFESDAPQADGMVVYEGKVLVAWYESGDSVVTAALDIGTGHEVWRRNQWAFPPIPDSVTIENERYVGRRICQGALGGNRWFMATGVHDNRPGMWGAPVCGATLAIDPADGTLLWRTTDHYITAGPDGLNYRNNTVVLWGWRSAQALDAATGQPLWQSSQGAWHLAPLTDDFLSGQGRSGTTRGGYCGDQVWANGLFFGPALTSSAFNFTAKTAAGLEQWRYIPISKGCAAPALAYGRLYYVPHGEGVVYCFCGLNEPSATRESPGLANSLAKIYPNPFNPATTISFCLPTKGAVNVAIYDVQGKLIKQLINGQKPQGNCRAAWNGTDDRGRRAASGIYLCKIITPGKIEKKKILLAK